VSLGVPRLHLRITDSTNDRARELALRGAPHGTLVTAGEQSAGRGRGGRTWSAPAGRALLASLILRDPPRLLPIAAGMAVAQLVGPEAQLKWPNDVLLGGRKVAGILVEGRPQERWAVLGIGLNVAVRIEDLPSDLQRRAGTLDLQPDDLEPTLARLLGLMELWLETDAAAVLSAARERDALRGKKLRWAGGEGVGRGIDDDGRLMVEVRNERIALNAGEVHLL
jgi:BirA family transcriptional regulator, biotin operon repressor / biotin---[acetyl-CoA-carboxylase] ligase